MKRLTFRKLHVANTRRCPLAFKHEIKDWTPEQYGNAAAGEMGEACNKIKKRFSRKNKRVSLKSIGDELADVICYIDLLAELTSLVSSPQSVLPNGFQLCTCSGTVYFKSFSMLSIASGDKVFSSVLIFAPCLSSSSLHLVQVTLAIVLVHVCLLSHGMLQSVVSALCNQ